MNKILLSSPHMGGSEEHYIRQAFESNWIAPLGPNVDQFENALGNFTQTNYVAALSSGTASLHLSLILAGVQSGDFVFCQTFTFSASANPIYYLGANPVFIDSEKDTWNMDPNLLKKALKAAHLKNRLPKAIIPVHLYGMPAKIDQLIAIASEYDIPVIEDAAEALGSTFARKACGSFGKFGILSFNGNKIITTSGGGALISNDEELIQKAKFLATQARDNAPHYQHSEIGYNYRLSNVLAGIGIGQLEVLHERIISRRSNFNKYQSYFNKWNERGFQIKFQEEHNDSFSNRWLSCILVDPIKNKGLHREEIRLSLDAANIESRPLWKPMHQQPVFKNCEAYISGVSDYLFEVGLCLPSGSNMTNDEFERIFKCLDSIFKKYV